MRSLSRHGVWIVPVGLLVALAVAWLVVRAPQTEELTTPSFAANIARDSLPATLEAPPAESRPAPVPPAERVEYRVTLPVFPVDDPSQPQPTPESGTLHVRVIDAQASVLSGIVGELTLTAGPGWVRAASEAEPPARRVDIPESGAQDFEALPFGVWTLTCSAQGYRDQHERIVLDARHAEKWLNIALAVHRPLHIALRDTNGNPLVASLERESPGLASALRFELHTVSADARSEFVAYRALASVIPARTPTDDAHWRSASVASLAALSVSIFLGDALVGRAEVARNSEDVTVFVSPLAFREALGVLSVIVLDDDHRPVARARVTARGTSGYDSVLSTDTDGRVRFERVLAGNIVVALSTSGYLEETQSVAVAPNAETSVTLHASEPVTISGTVRMPVGATDVFVAYSSDPAARAGAQAAWVVVLVTGPSFELRDLHKGEYALTAFPLPSDNGHDELMQWNVDAVRFTAIEHQYVDARRGSVSNVGLSVSGEAPK